MSTEEQTVVEETSVILDTAEVEAAVASEEGEVILEPEDTTLPSDRETFDMPDKFVGKSAEDIAKAYLELEKMKGEPTKEEPVTEPTKETSEETLDTNKYYDSYLKNDGLTEEDYAELETKGISKEQVDEQIEFIKYKVEKAQNELLDGIGTIDEFNQSAIKAREAWGEDKAKQFNEDLAKASPTTQKLMVKALMDEFKGDVTPTDTTPVHSSTPQTNPSKGYKNRGELLADMSDPRYETDKTFNAQVLNKLEITDDSGW